MSSRTRSPTLEYITRTFVHEPDWLCAVREAGEARVPGMQLSPYEGQLLSWLVKVSGARSILEIGSFMGYSSLWMASALPDGGNIISLEARAEHATLASAHISASPYANKVKVIEADALYWMQSQPASRQYDFLFIDAEKRAYPNYLEAALPLLSTKAWVVADNTLLFGALSGEDARAASKEAIQAMTRFNAILANPEMFDGILLPTSEGLTIARKTF